MTPATPTAATATETRFVLRCAGREVICRDAASALLEAKAWEKQGQSVTVVVVKTRVIYRTGEVLGNE